MIIGACGFPDRSWRRAGRGGILRGRSELGSRQVVADVVEHPSRVVVQQRHDGVAAVIEALKGHPLFAHVTLTRSERSPIAALVTDLLEGIEV
jgi:predicted ribonuclease YlaK